MNNCASCHGRKGAGKLQADGAEYLYPPLWGPHSYNMGAGLYRISKFDSYVENNMPFGTTYHHPVLTAEQAWDVAAFVNSQPHPLYKDMEKDWPDIADKPFDYPFGPYADTFSEKQHKYGPFFKITKCESQRLKKY
jgi:thiosulfate dehydrogenase